MLIPSRIPNALAGVCRLHHVCTLRCAAMPTTYTGLTKVILITFNLIVLFYMVDLITIVGLFFTLRSMKIEDSIQSSAETESS